MSSHKAQIPHQDLPDEGSALASGSTKTEAVVGGTPSHKDSMAPRTRSKATPVSHLDTITSALNMAAEVVNDLTLESWIGLFF